MSIFFSWFVTYAPPRTSHADLVMDVAVTRRNFRRSEGFVLFICVRLSEADS